MIYQTTDMCVWVYAFSGLLHCLSVASSLGVPVSAVMAGLQCVLACTHACLSVCGRMFLHASICEMTHCSDYLRSSEAAAEVTCRAEGASVVLVVVSVTPYKAGRVRTGNLLWG